MFWMRQWILCLVQKGAGSLRTKEKKAALGDKQRGKSRPLEGRKRSQEQPRRLDVKLGAKVKKTKLERCAMKDGRPSRTACNPALYTRVQHKTCLHLLVEKKTSDSPSHQTVQTKLGRGTKQKGLLCKVVLYWIQKHYIVVVGGRSW